MRGSTQARFKWRLLLATTGVAVATLVLATALLAPASRKDVPAPDLATSRDDGGLRRRAVHPERRSSDWHGAARESYSSQLLLALHPGPSHASDGLPRCVNITLDPRRARRHWRYIRRAIFRARLASANRSSPTDRLCTPGSGDCEFYRSEAPPPAERPDGPPYALLQGRMRGLLPAAGGDLPHEPSPKGGIRPGDVVRIQGADFFIALGPHDSWAASFTVIGRIETSAELDALTTFTTRAAFRVATHSSGTKMRLLERSVGFTVGCG